MPVITARASGSRGVHDEINAGVERGEVSLDVVTLRDNGRVSRAFEKLDVLAVVVANGLPEIAARASGSRGVQDEIDAGVEREVIDLDVVTLRDNGRVSRAFEKLDVLAAVVANSLPVIAAGTLRSRGVHDEVDARIEREVIGLDGVALRDNGGVKSELHLLDGLAAVVANSLPVIAAGTLRSRGVHDEVDTVVEHEVVSLDGVALRSNGGVKSELELLDGLAAFVACSLPEITTGTLRSRGVHDEVDAGIEHEVICLDGVALRGNDGVKGEL